MDRDPNESGPARLFRQRPWTAPVLASLCLAVMSVCIKALSSPTRQGSYCLPTQELMLLRSLLPSLMLAPLAWRDSARLPTLPRSEAFGLTMRGLCGASAMVCYFLAVRWAPLSVAVLTSNTSPLWTTLMAALFLRERPPRQLLWALPLALLGSALLVQVSASTQAPGVRWGAAAGLASAALSGAAYTWVRRLRSLPASWVALSLTSTATLVTLPWLSAWIWPAPAAWSWILTMGLAGGLAQLMMTLGFHYNAASQASSLGLFGVLFSTLLAYLVFGEALSPPQCLGMLLILVGLLAMASAPSVSSDR